MSRRPYAERKHSERERERAALEMKNLIEHVIQTCHDYIIDELNGHAIVIEQPGIDNLLGELRRKLLVYAHPPKEVKSKTSI
jgi:hypothetical protein